MSDHSTPEQEPGFFAQLLVGLVGWVGRHPLWTCLFIAGTCSAALAFAALRLEYQTQRNDLISKHKDYYQRWLRYSAEFGEDNDMVAVLKGPSRERLTPILEELADEIRKEPERFDRLFYKVDLGHLQNRSLLYLPSQQIRLVQDHLQSMSKLLLAGSFSQEYAWKSVTLQNHFFEAVNSASTLRSAADARPDHDPVLKQLSATCAKANRFLENPDDYQSPWQRLIETDANQQDQLRQPQYFFGPDGTVAYVVVRPKKNEADGFTFDQQSIRTLRELLSQLKQRHADIDCGLTGMPVLENDEMEASQNDSNRASWLALLGVALLYFVVYRGMRYPLMTIASLLVGTIWALGWLTLTVGHLNILSSAFAVMLIGMGDYGILWVTRFGQERQAGHDVQEANRRTALSVGPSILTAAITTAFSFFAAMLADLQAVAELGWIAGCGVILCAFSCFLVMPALLALFDFRGAQNPDILPIAERRQSRRPWLPRLLRQPRLVIACSLGTMAFLGYYALQVKYDHNLLHLQAEDLSSVQWEHVLLEQTRGAGIHAVSVTSTPEEALVLKERFEKLPSVSQVHTLASIVPREQERKLEQLRDIQNRLASLPPRAKAFAHDLPKAEDLQRAGKDLLASLERLPPTLLVTELRTHLGSLLERLRSDPGSPARLKVFQERMVRDLVGDLHDLRDASEPSAISLSDIPASLQERFVGKNGKWLVRVFAKENLWEYEALDRFVAELRTVDSEACGRPYSILEGLRGMQIGFLWAALYALIAMVVVLLLDFGSARHMLVALFPLAMGMIATLGIMTLLGYALNPANMISFPLILGVGADNGVHVMHDYRNRPRGRRYSLGYTTGRGIMVAALTTILGFGTLMIAQHRGMASLGLVLTLGVTCCMLTALVFLPALLGLLSMRRQENVALVPIPLTHDRAA